MNKFKVGDKVVFIDNKKHRAFPICFPKVGTIGTIVSTHACNCYVQWEKGSTSENDLWCTNYDRIKHYNTKSIHIYSDGKTTTAILKEGKTEVKKATANCSLDDTYNFETGARLAFDRLIDKEVKPGVKPEFIPHLESYGGNYGTIGNKTLLKDIFDRPLCIGDTVDLYDNTGKLSGERSIVFADGKAFVMGIEMHCHNYGTILRGWKIIKKRSHTEVADGESVDGVKYIKKEQ